MKNVFITYVILVHIAAGFAIANPETVIGLYGRLGIKKDQPELTAYYHTTVAFHKRVNVNIPDNSVIFIGDSIVQGLAVTAVSPQAVNFGISQDTTVGVLNRIPYYSSISRAKAIVISIGVNDLKIRDNDEIVRNYRAMVENIPGKVPVLFSAIMPIDEVSSHWDGFNLRIRGINSRLRDLCANDKRLYFLDISSQVVDSSGNLAGKYHIGDGVHLNGEGNRIWIKNLKQLLGNL